MSKMFDHISENWSSLKGRNLLQKSRPLFQKGPSVQKNKHGITKSVSLVTTGRRSTKCVEYPYHQRRAPINPLTTEKTPPHYILEESNFYCR